MFSFPNLCRRYVVLVGSIELWTGRWMELGFWLAGVEGRRSVGSCQAFSPPWSSVQWMMEALAIK